MFLVDSNYFSFFIYHRYENHCPTSPSPPNLWSAQRLIVMACEFFVFEYMVLKWLCYFGRSLCFVCHLDTSWSYHRERSLPWGDASMRSSCKEFSQLVIKGMGEGPAHCRWYHPWAGSPGFYKKASHGKQGSMKYPSIPSASAPASWPAWVPVMTSSGAEQQCGHVS